MKFYSNPARTLWDDISRRPRMSRDDLFPRVRSILDAVKREGDEALIRLTGELDGVALSSVVCREKEFEDAAVNVSLQLKGDIRLAIANVRAFHHAQKEEIRVVETQKGVRCWREARAIEKVGLYVPGGTAPLFSSVVMLAVPAVLAGCSEIVLCSPPQKDGSLHPAILWTAREIGVTTVCKIGGAQAIAAMAYGTASVPAVYKILGPGNQYVTAAKLLVSTEEVAIDMPAGPSEVLVIADGKADPEFIASDLLSQAEHGTDSQVLLVTDDPRLPERVHAEIRRQLPLLGRADIAEAALENSKLLVLKNLDECMEFSNHYAPEHLILHTENADKLSKKVVNAGSVFLGEYTPESAGDYASGTNHTLPTAAFARNYSGVSLDSYLKKVTFQTISPKGLSLIGPAIEHMAAAEGLDAHKLAVTKRLNKIGKR